MGNHGKSTISIWKTYRKRWNIHQFLMGKAYYFDWAIFDSKLLVYQRVPCGNSLLPHRSHGYVKIVDLPKLKMVLLHVWIGLREHFNRTAPYFMGKSMVSGYDFPLNQSIETWGNSFQREWGLNINDGFHDQKQIRLNITWHAWGCDMM